jgi:hypothetical protein
MGVMISPRKTFFESAEHPNEWHVRILSLCFGFLIAGQIIQSENRDMIVYLTTALSSGIGFVYFSGYFMSWLIKLTGSHVYPEKMRMVLAYALTPYILALVLLLIAKTVTIPMASMIGFILIVWSWFLAVFGVKTVGGLKRVQALFVVIIPIAALLLVVSILFKVVWMMYGY